MEQHGPGRPEGLDQEISQKNSPEKQRAGGGLFAEAATRFCSRDGELNYWITPQAIRLPALPAGSVLPSSAFS